MKAIINQYGPPKAFNARYDCAYSTITKPEWYYMKWFDRLKVGQRYIWRANCGAGDQIVQFIFDGQ